jgi:hypothetical protein
MANIDLSGNTIINGSGPPGSTANNTGLAGLVIGSAGVITALNAGTQSTSPLVAFRQTAVNSAAAAAGVRLPPAQPGAEILIQNLGSGANTITVFGSVGDSINVAGTVTSGATGVIQAISSCTIYSCFQANLWVAK